VVQDAALGQLNIYIHTNGLHEFPTMLCSRPYSRVEKVAVLAHLNVDKYTLKFSNNAVQHITLKVPYKCPEYEQTICHVRSNILTMLVFFRSSSLEMYRFFRALFIIISSKNLQCLSITIKRRISVAECLLETVKNLHPKINWQYVLIILFKLILTKHVNHKMKHRN